MFFRHAHVYRLTVPLDIDGSALETALQQQAFTPCGGLRPSSFGWVAPVAEGGLVHEAAGCLLLCAKREDKVVPGSALAEILDEKITRLEALEKRPVRAREKQRFKEDALAELLPRALPKSKRISGYISPADNLLVIDTVSSSEAEMFLDCLRQSLGSLKVTPPQVRSKPADTFTHWLHTRKLPEHFTLGDQCDLADPEDGSTVSCRKQDLATGEIRAHLDAGKTCIRLSLVWHGDMRVVVDKNLVLRQIKSLSTHDGDDEYDNAIAQTDAAFANMTLELSRFLPAFYLALGGEHKA